MLWESEDIGCWSQALEQYRETIEKLDKAELSRLDRWYHEELPQQVKEREPHHLTSQELVQLVQWKLTRGKWRPRLVDFAKQHSDATVKATTSEAFEILKAAGSPVPLDDVLKALNKLSALKGIGPATASGVLCVVEPSTPFMSDEAIAVAVQGKKDYSAKQYRILTEALRDKAEQLTQREGEGGHVWTAVEVEMAVWCDAAKQKVDSKGTARKRKR